jgi:hypothetical protein
MRTNLEWLVEVGIGQARPAYEALRLAYIGSGQASLFP